MEDENSLYTCIYTKTKFAVSDGEHILQNFLGARWVSQTISSNEAQGKFGETIDVALEQGLREIRNTLGTKGGRGGEGPSLKNIVGDSGTVYTLAPGGAPSISEPVLKTRPLPDGRHEIQAVLGDMNQLGWAVAKMRQAFPGTKFDINEIRQHAVKTQRYVNDSMRLQSGLGGDDFFRGALKAAFNLLGAQNAEIALLPICDGVRNFVLTGEGECSSFVRWLTRTDEIALPRIGEFDHFVSVYSRNGSIDGFIQFFGEIGFLLRLADGYAGPAFSFGYLVDPFREGDPAETREPNYSIENIPRFESGSVLPTEQVWPIYSARFSRILERHYRRADQQNLSRIVDEVLLPHDGEVVTKELIEELSRKAAEYIVHRLFSSPRPDKQKPRQAGSQKSAKRRRSRKKKGRGK
ncbi:hypothetical protein [Burkholderia vietnamiensis]|uniref:hypothetical protein n=1 Tax=Burkholderia vietnamiensis TaxID=60552 RepID=UPI001B8E0E92|nr:hypothetical protein [Burkholderia vietnamiensis]MBR8005556.1 hypothetical protein [Burkholderia vietnamiensis]